MNTIVAKMSDYSLNKMKELRNSEIKDINLVLISRNGYTDKFQTSEKMLEDFTEEESSIIYR